MERRRNGTKGKAPIIGERALCRESYVFLTGEMSMGTIGNCYEAPTTDTSASRVGYKLSKVFSAYRQNNIILHVISYTIIEYYCPHHRCIINY